MWEEEKHPRDNDGKFTEKDGGGTSSYSKQVDKARQTLNRLIGDYKKRVTLSNVEWSKFYSKIAEVQHGGSCINIKSGNQIVMIEQDNIHTVICYNGDFINPQVHITVKVEDDNVEDLASIINFIKEVF